jgi:hypothetical protein
MSNHPCRFESSIIFGWDDGSYSGAYLQVLPDGTIAKVDGFLRVQETMTVEEARVLKESIVNDPHWKDGYWGTPPNARFHLASYNPLEPRGSVTKKP